MNLNVSVGCLPGASNAVQFPPDFGIPLDRPITEVKKKRMVAIYCDYCVLSSCVMAELRLCPYNHN